VICKKVDFKLKNFIPAIAWAVVILILSASSGVKIPESLSEIKGTDKIGHIAIYTIFSIFIFFGVFKTENKMPGNSIALFIVGLSSAYGILMEIMQFAFFTGRYFEVLDIIANIIGSFTGLFIFKYFINKKS
jgi:VanZ family protein